MLRCSQLQSNVLNYQIQHTLELIDLTIKSRKKRIFCAISYLDPFALKIKENNEK